MAADLRSRFHEFWLARNPRERLALGLAALVVGGAAFYAGVWQPLHRAHARLEARLPQLRAEARMLRIQAVEVERLRSKLAGRQASQGSLSARAEGLAAARGVALERVQALGQDRLQVIAKPTPAGAWMGWILDLERQGIAVASLRLSSEEKGDSARGGLVRGEALLGVARP